MLAFEDFVGSHNYSFIINTLLLIMLIALITVM
jgi:hypothetical protein